MPGETNTDRIIALTVNVATHLERLEILDRNFDEVKGNASRSDERFREADKQLAILVRDVERLEKKLDELLSRRWELWKLVLAAFLGGILTLATGFVSRSLDLSIA